jgi:cytochrome P450 family 9
VRYTNINENMLTKRKIFFFIFSLIGFFDFRTPKYLIRDPEIFKQISVKDFESFEDREVFIKPEVDSLFGNSILCLRGKKWHDMRAILSPGFTGMRQLFINRQ